MNKFWLKKKTGLAAQSEQSRDVYQGFGLPKPPRSTPGQSTANPHNTSFKLKQDHDAIFEPETK